MPKKKEAGAAVAPEVAAEAALQAQIKKYQPVEGPTHRQLQWGLWWSQNRQKFYWALVGCLMVIGVLTWGWTLWTFGWYAAVGIDEDNRNLAALTGTQINHSALQAQRAQDLEVGTINILPANNFYDVAVAVRNPNADWYVRFDFSFVSSAGETTIQSEFLLPQETKYLTSFLNQGSAPASLQLRLAQVGWRRVDKTITNNTENFLKEYLDITVSDIKVEPLSLSDAGGARLQVVQFNLYNQSAYNYWEVPLIMVARSATQVYGINRLVVNKLLSGEKRTLSMLWPAGVPAGGIEVIPSVDIFAADNFMPFDLGSGQLK